jgi:hypothetical protein
VKATQIDHKQKESVIDDLKQNVFQIFTSVVISTQI